MTAHFGRNPRRGGSPPRDSNRVIILIDLSVLSLNNVEVFRVVWCVCRRVSISASAIRMYNIRYR